MYNTLGAMVFRRCFQLLKDKEEGVDCTQDVFVTLYEKRQNLKDDYPSALLFRMATNAALNRIRTRKTRNEDTEDNLVESIACFVDTERRLESRSLLRRLFGRQSEDTRVIAMLYYFDGFTLRELAKQVGLSVSGVKHHLDKIKSALQDIHED